VRRALAIAGLLASACATEDELGGPDLDASQYPLPRLSDYRFFTDLPAQEPNDGVIPYGVNAPLWADAAEKGRYFVLPEGGKIQFTEQDEWGFPTGTVFIKTFYFDQDRGAAEDLRIIETRLLVLAESGDWDAHIYLWDEAQTDGEHLKAGADVMVDYVDESGAPGSQLYLVPDQNTCESCHQRDDRIVLLGPSTHQLNRESTIEGERVNTIDWLRDNDLFGGEVLAAAELPAFADPAGDATIDERARAYLHGNCSHCHRPGGDGGASGLKFSYFEQDPAEFGVCKLPAAAGAGAGGRTFDIFPGRPEESIVPFRMASEDPEIKMPELPSLLSDPFGVTLIEDWIRAMPPQDCEG
jgi:uncharacterized repeat protein (TIGR03806 family)